jgi:hypothetical protein
LARLERSVAVIGEFLTSAGDGRTARRATEEELAEVEQSVRKVYWTISALRDKWRTRSLFTPRDRSRIPGFDVYSSFGDLFDDVVAELRTTETAVCKVKAQDSGLRVTSMVMNERTSPGEPVNCQIAVSSLSQPVEIRSIVLTSDQAVDTLLSVNPPLGIAPARDAQKYYHRYPTLGARGSTILPVRYSVEVQFADKRRLRYHFNHGVYVTHPVTFAVTFPRGRILVAGSVPLDIAINKHVSGSAVINAQWYSPAGLTPAEGRSLKMVMPEDAGTVTMQLNVPVPTACRPGSFPFILKLFADGEDAGAVRSSLFRHYQWIYTGPFAQKTDALSVEYPPEHGVNLRDRFEGAIRPISWMTLPDNAYAEAGDIDLGSLLPEESVGYLYTVIKTAGEKKTAVVFASRSPAVLFINGDEVLRVTQEETGVKHRVVVGLKHGMNNILIKLLSSVDKIVFFELGDEDDLTSDEFNNNLWELVDGYQDFYAASLSQHEDTSVTPRVVTLTYHGADANSVAVIGSFNGWSPVSSNLRRGKNGGWEISLHLTPGRYAYRFLVNNNHQVLDPKCDTEEPDGYGGKNSVLFVR